MAQPAQGTGGGWATSRLVGGQGKTPIIGQKQLRGKMVNLNTAGNIKKSKLCTMNKKSKQKKGGRKEKQERIET